uniref:Uncharacterized protein n=1 Tax=viral metagenome TaxID=1070528 RepID=A0A6C0AES6_9ZZZZ
MDTFWLNNNYYFYISIFLLILNKKSLKYQRKDQKMKKIWLNIKKLLFPVHNKLK